GVLRGGWVRLASRLAQSLGLWERTGGLVGSVASSKLFVGLAQLVTEMQGKERDATAENSIGELICYAEMLRMSLEYACRNYEKTPSGMVHPNALAVNAAKYYYAANYHNMVKYLHDLSGGLVITLPSEADLRNEETGRYMRKYLHTKPTVDVETRMRVYNLIREPTAGAYGGWDLLVGVRGGRGARWARCLVDPHLVNEYRRAESRVGH